MSMRYHFFCPHDPAKMPTVLRIVLGASLVLSICSALFSHIFMEYFGWLSPFELLSLSTQGLERGFFWQPFTFLFLHPLSNSLSLSLLISLAFNAYLLWFAGSTVIARKGVRHFLFLYFGSGAIATLILYFLAGPYILPACFAGQQVALFSLFTAWIILHPDLELRYLMLLPMKAKWLFVTVLLATFLINISNGQITDAFAFMIATLFSYFYCILAWRLRGPFPKLHRFEEKLQLVRKLITPWKAIRSGNKTKIYDFQTGEVIIGEEAYIDVSSKKSKKRFWKFSSKKNSD